MILLTKDLAADNKKLVRKRSIIKLDYNSIKIKVKVFRNLQKTFISLIFLTYFDITRLLFINLVSGTGV